MMEFLRLRGLYFMRVWLEDVMETEQQPGLEKVGAIWTEQLPHLPP